MILSIIGSLLISLSHRNVVTAISFGCRAICRNTFSMSVMIPILQISLENYTDIQISQVLKLRLVYFVLT